jgi:hypothetical protein
MLARRAHGRVDGGRDLAIEERPLGPAAVFVVVERALDIVEVAADIDGAVAGFLGQPGEIRQAVERNVQLPG